MRDLRRALTVRVSGAHPASSIHQWTLDLLTMTERGREWLRDDLVEGRLLPVDMTLEMALKELDDIANWMSCRGKPEDDTVEKTMYRVFRVIAVDLTDRVILAERTIIAQDIERAKMTVLLDLARTDLDNLHFISAHLGDLPEAKDGKVNG